jgi:N-acetylmuramic acid 6-phosphate (MurNAc-6-P) etherase
VRPEEAMEALEKAEGDLKVAVVMISFGMDRREAEKALAESGGILRRALERVT